MSLDIYSCTDLPSFFGRVKGHKRFKSVRHLSRCLGFSSDRGLGMMMTGSRPMSESVKSRIAEWLKLTPGEFQYLSILVQKDIAERKGALNTESLNKRLSGLRPAKSAKIEMSTEQLKELAQWYYHVVIDVVEVLGKKATEENIWRSFKSKVSRAKIKSCLKKQVELGRLQLDSGIYARALEGNYWVDKQVPSVYIRETHRQFIQQAELAIDEQSILDRQLTTMTFALSKNQIESAKKRILEVMQSLMEELQTKDEGPKAIYQTNLQFFRVADPSDI